MVLLSTSPLLLLAYLFCGPPRRRRRRRRLLMVEKEIENDEAVDFFFVGLGTAWSGHRPNKPQRGKINNLGLPTGVDR